MYNLTVPQLYHWGLKGNAPADFDTRNTTISSTGALVAFSGTRYGRSPKDKRVVKDAITEKDVAWGKVNIPIDTDTNRFCRDLAIKFLNTRPKLYIQDGYVGWDPKYRLKCRCVVTRAYHALFMRNMLIRPTAEELQ
jgi:phosphoenolpyruvate carboxykinase (ATP)